jgi:phosphatidylserine/phosphatidylglycerophosphate/cardiolipin synthase-like enzyme
MMVVPSRLLRFAALSVLLLALVCAAEPVSAGTYSARTTLLRNREFAEALLENVRAAKKSIYFSFFLFKATDSRNNLPRQIAEELVRAKRRGVDVTVLLERQSPKRQQGQDSLNEDNRNTAALLSRGGVKVFFDSPNVTTHTKVAVIDGYRVFVGSHNLSQSALVHNNELSVMVDSPELATEVKSYLDRL